MSAAERRRATPAESATARLGRLLTLVPWLLDHQGVPVEQAAETFGVTPAQLEADLALLFVCGTPGHLPDDLIDADWEDGRIFLTNAESLARPWRLIAMKPCSSSFMGPSAGLASVSIGPGCTTLIVIPRDPKSRASPRAIPCSADLLSA